MRRSLTLVLSLCVLVSLMLSSVAFSGSVSAQSVGPAPTATPKYNREQLGRGPGKFQLVPASEENLLQSAAMLQEIITKGELSATAANPAKEYGPADYRQARLTVLREALMRYPEDTLAIEDLIAETLMASEGENWFGQPADDMELLRVIIQDQMSTLAANFKDWITHVNPEIQVADPIIAPNVIFKGQDVQIFKVMNGTKMAVFVMRERKIDTWNVYTLYPEWIETAGHTVKIDLLDLNGNKKPEIVLQYSGKDDSAKTCSQVLDAFEWNFSFFRNIAAYVDEVSTTASLGECKGFSFTPAKADAKASPQTIISSITMGQSTQTRVYDWNPALKMFEWSKDTVTLNPVPTTAPDKLAWAQTAGPENDQALSILEDVVTNFPGDLEQAYGPAARDYLRYKLGVWYAMRGDSEKALTTLRQSIDKPYNPKFKTFSSWADTFYKVYSVEKRLYPACAGVNRQFEFMREKYAPPKPTNAPTATPTPTSQVGSAFAPTPVVTYDAAKMKEAWGYVEPAWSTDLQNGNFGIIQNADPLGICSLYDAFRISLKNTPMPSPTGIAYFFTFNSVPFTGLWGGDTDGDWMGKDEKVDGTDPDDYFALVGTGYMGRLQLWAFIRDGKTMNGSVLRTLGTPKRNVGSLWRGFTPYYDQPLTNAYQIDDRLFLFRLVDHATGSKDPQIGAVYPVSRADGRYVNADVNSFEIYIDGSTRQLIFSTRMRDDLQYVGWSDETQTVAFEGPSLEGQLNEIDEALYDPAEANPEEALNLVTRMLRANFFDEKVWRYPYGQAPLPRTRPNLLYLQALAYDLTGKPAEAVKIYWQLLVDFPQSPYALLAANRIELK